MKPPPAQIDGARVLHFSILDPRHESAVGLALCRYDRDSSVFLFGCDENWACLIHTRHQTVEEAMTQAEFEYDCVPKWRSL